MWLDYDGKLSPRKQLEEIHLAVATLARPSFFAVSVNVQTWAEDERLAKFQETWSDKDQSRIRSNADLSWNKYPALMYEYIAAAIATGLADRTDGAGYGQVLHIRYSDGANMLTVGGLIYGEDSDWTACDFESLPFEGSKPAVICSGSPN